MLSWHQNILKDNSVSAVATDTNPLAELVKVLPFDEKGVDKVVKKAKNE